MARTADCVEPDFAERCAAYDRRSYIPLLHPTMHRARGYVLSYFSPYDRLFRRPADDAPARELLDASQNAGCVIFGHAAPEVVSATEDVLRRRPPIRLPLARASDAETRLRDAILSMVAGDGNTVALESGGAGGEDVSATAAAEEESWWHDYSCVLGMRSGAEALDAALTIAVSRVVPHAHTGPISAQACTISAHLPAPAALSTLPQPLAPTASTTASSPASHPADGIVEGSPQAPPAPPPAPPSWPPHPPHALSPAPPSVEPPSCPRLMLVTLRGGFHGNCTRAAFSASEVFRRHAAAGVLVDMQVHYS